MAFPIHFGVSIGVVCSAHIWAVMLVASDRTANSLISWFLESFLSLFQNVLGPYVRKCVPSVARSLLDGGEILYYLMQKKNYRPKVTTLPSLTSEDRGVPAASVCFFIYKMGL